MLFSRTSMAMKSPGNLSAGKPCGRNLSINYLGWVALVDPAVDTVELPRSSYRMRMAANYIGECTPLIFSSSSRRVSLGLGTLEDPRVVVPRIADIGNVSPTDMSTGMDITIAMNAGMWVHFNGFCL